MIGPTSNDVVRKDDRHTCVHSIVPIECLSLEMYNGLAEQLLIVQDDFAKKDMSQGKTVVPFINVFDKGYRVLLDCYKEGEQLCWQPAFARSDERYGTYATLHTAAVAYTRSGNERSVKHMKHSWLLKRGTFGMPRFDLELLSDIWLAWGFQVNFIYKPVH